MKSLRVGNKYVESVKQAVKDEGSEVFLIATAIEAEIAELDDLEEQIIFLESWD